MCYSYSVSYSQQKEKEELSLKPFIRFSSTILCILFLAACSAPPDVKAPTTTEQKVVEQEQSKENENVEDPSEQIVSVKMGDLETLKKDVASKEEYVLALEKELAYYKKYVQSISQTMSDENKAMLIDKEWTYSLTINGVEFPKSGTLTLNQSTFDVVMKEERTPYSVLTDEDSLKGKVTTDVKSGFRLTSEFVEESERVDDLVQELTYKATNVPSGTEISIQLSEELQQKLKLDVGQLTISIQ